MLKLSGSVPVERPNPPQTVFSLPPSNRLPPQQNFQQRQAERPNNRFFNKYRQNPVIPFNLSWLPYISVLSQWALSNRKIIFYVLILSLTG